MLSGIIIGFFIGIGVALAVAIFVKQSPSPFVEHGSTAPASAGTAESPSTANAGVELPDKAGPSSSATPNKPRFDFYTILPGTEVPVSEQEIEQASRPSRDLFFLQVGAFQTQPEADNVKAKLALLGIEASVQTADIPDKGLMHRVRVGPFANLEELSQMRTTLVQNGIPASPIKVHQDKPKN
jgi:cell division protein FtsN